MRFEDTLEGWNSQLDQLLVDRHIRRFLSAISKSQPIIVPNKHADHLSTVERMCHKIVRDQVSAMGGAAVFGWIVAPWLYHDIDVLDHSVTASFHCNWQDTAGDISNLTQLEGKYHIFLPDPVRQYDFDKNISFNNRTIYLDACNLPKALGYRAKNVTYFTNQRYASRDRQFERFRRVGSMADLKVALQSAGFPLIDDMAMDYSTQEYVFLRFNVAA